MADTRFLALVSSFNRLEMVQRCVVSLRSQTRKLDAILVVDSSTKPELRAWLDGQADVTKLYIDDLGSAGAMHYGMKFGCENGFDWVWAMDDDVETCPTALAELERATRLLPSARVLNSFSTAAGDPSVPAVGAIRWRNDPNDYLHGVNLFTTAEVYAHANADGFLDSAGGQIFQGVLIHRSVVEKVGLPLLAMFTRGDEVEYGLRVMRAGYHIYSFLPSRVEHPRTRIRFLSLFGKKLPCESMNARQRYYNVRNGIFLRKEYYVGYPFLPYVARRMAGGFIAEIYYAPDKSWGERANSFAAVVRGVFDGLRMLA